MEFKMMTVLESVLPKEILFNYEELKSELAEKLEKYNRMVVTEDGLAAAKKDRAALNKLLKALDDKRIEVKRELLKPFGEFEAQVKEIQAMIAKPVGVIDAQIKAFDDAKKQEKESAIRGIYAANIGNLGELLPIERLWNPRWLNVTYRMEDIEKEIVDAVFKVGNDLKIIRVTCGDYAEQVTDKYLQSLDMSAALSEKARLEEQAEALKKVVPQEPKVHVAPNDGIPPVEPEGDFTQVLNPVDFRVWATREQLMRLKAFLKENNIKYGRVPECR